MFNKFLGFVVFLFVSSTVFAFDEGIEYSKLPVPLTTTSEDKVEVLEVFWYGCPHCYTLESALDKWEKPDYIDLKLLPAISKSGWAATGAQTFFTAVALGKLDKIHSPLFKAIHVDNKSALRSDPQAIADFFSQYEVSEEEFFSTWKSFYVNNKMRAATRTFTDTGIDGVPAVIVSGKYLTSPSMAGGSEKMLQVVEYLAKKEIGSKTK